MATFRIGSTCRSANRRIRRAVWAAAVWAAAPWLIVMLPPVVSPSTAQDTGIDRPEALAPDVADALARFMAQGRAGYFAVSRDGTRFGLATCPRDPFCRREFAVSAFGACRAAGAEACMIYASKRRTGTTGFARLRAGDLPPGSAIAETLMAPSPERASATPMRRDPAETTAPPIGTAGSATSVAALPATPSPVTAAPASALSATTAGRPRAEPVLDLAKVIEPEAARDVSPDPRQALGNVATPRRTVDLSGIAANPDPVGTPASAARATQVAVAPVPDTAAIPRPPGAAQSRVPTPGATNRRLASTPAPAAPVEETKAPGAAGGMSPEVLEAFQNFRSSGVQAVFAVSDDGQTWGVALCRDVRRCDFADTLNAIEDCLASGAESCAIFAYQDPTTDRRPAAPVGGS